MPLCFPCFYFQTVICDNSNFVHKCRNYLNFLATVNISNKDDAHTMIADNISISPPSCVFVCIYYIDDAMPNTIRLFAILGMY